MNKIEARLGALVLGSSVVFSCGEEPEPTEKPAETYRYRLSILARNNQILNCYADERDFLIFDDGTVIGILTDAYCPDSDLMQRVFRMEGTYFERLSTADSRSQVWQILDQKSFIDEGEPIPDPIFAE